MVATAHGNEVSFYLDGAPLGTRTMPSGSVMQTCPDGTSPSFIGAENNYYYPDYGYPGYGEAFTGSIEQTIMYSTALSAQEIGDMATCEETRSTLDTSGSDDSSDATWIGLSCGASFIILVTGYCYNKMHGSKEKTKTDVLKARYIESIVDLEGDTNVGDLWKKPTEELGKAVKMRHGSIIAEEYGHTPEAKSWHDKSPSQVVDMYKKVSDTRIGGRASLKSRPSAFM